jgi:uncharacterized protein (TIGR00369 family)
VFRAIVSFVFVFEQYDPSVERQRTFTWHDPTSLFKRRAAMSGVEVLQLVINGELPAPPMASLMDIQLIEASKGRAVFRGVPQEFHYNPLGSVHGGYGATLLDSAMGCTVHSMLDAGDTYTTLEFKINFLRAMTHETGEVRGIGTIVHAGRTTAIAEGRIEDAAGRLYAFATTTCQIKRVQN